MNEKELKKLINDYGYAPSNYKYIPMACEILKCIGQSVVLVSYERPEKKEGEEQDPSAGWNTSTKLVNILSISDHDPMTMTYLVKYKEDKSEEEKEVRIQPEGYEFCNPEETGHFIRLQPFSYHHQMMEDEFFFARLRKLYDERDTLPFDSLKTIANSKDQGQILRYSHNIGAAIELENGSLIWIRLYTLSLKHRQGSKYGLFFSNEGKEWSTLIDSSEKVYNIGGWGKLKIIDLAD